VIEARRSAAWDRTVVRFSAFARALTGRRLALAAVVAGLAIVWIVGVVQPGGSQPGQASTTGVGTDWGAGGSVGGLNLIDLVTKGALVLILLFVTLRVLGRAQGNVAKKSSSRLVVLESRSIASKASLHLVAVGGRRLVIGLTPSGMVSLAELDATELTDPEPESPTAADLDPLSTSPVPSGTAKPGFGPALDSLLAPLDRFGAGLYKLLSGGRAR
jgi:flagellar biogenesis protein FliO